MIIKRWNGSAFVAEYPETTPSKLITTGTRGSTTFLRGDDVWAVPVVTTVNGLSVHTGVNNEANKIVRTDGSGYVKFGWINTASGETAAAASHYFINTANDGYIRKKTLSDVRTEIVTKTAVDAVVTLPSLSGYLTTSVAASTYEPKITKGTAAQYFKGDMSLATFPTIPTIPSIMDTTEGNNGTVTTARTINAVNLKAIILNHSPAGARTPASHTLDSHTGVLAVAKGGTGNTYGHVNSADEAAYAEEAYGSEYSNQANNASRLGGELPAFYRNNVIKQVSFSGGTLTIEVV